MGEILAFDTEGLQHRYENVGQGRFSLLENEVFTRVFEIATRDEYGEITIGVGATIAQAATEEDLGPVE